MRRQVWKGLWTGLSLMVLGVPVMAEDETAPPPPPERTGRPGHPERNRDPVLDEIRFTQELREAMLKQLQLEDEQKTKVAELFAAHLEAVKKLAAERPDPADREEQLEKIRELERKAQEAREAGDREEARKLRRQIHELQQQAGGANLAELGRLDRQFIKDVTEVLEGEQARQFQRLVREVRGRMGQGDALLQFMRAVRRATAAVELDAQQQQKVGEIVREIMKGIERPRENPEAVKQLPEQLRAKLRPELGPERTDEFMTALEEELQHLESADETHPPHPEGEPPGPKPDEKGDEED